MNKVIMMSELELNRKRLDYYQQQSQKSKSAALEKWVDIYSTRVQKIERQLSRLGLKTQIKSETSNQRRA